MSNFQKTLGPVSLGSFNIGAAASASAMAPLLAQINTMLTDPFGIGSLKSDFVGQFKAQVNFSVTFSDPIAAIKATISASLSIVASLQTSLSLGLPTISTQVSSSLALAAALQAKIAGINALIDAALGVRLSGVNFLSQLNGALTGGAGAFAYGFTGVPMSGLPGQISAYSFAGDGFSPTDSVSGIMLLTKDPATFSSMQFLFVTAP